MQYGIRSVSMDEIASNLGISKKTIYQYYADKDALVNEVVDIEINRNETDCKYQQSVCENAIHEVFMAFDMVQEMLTTMNPSVLYDLEKYYPSSFKKFHEHKNKFLFKAIKDNLLKGINEELYRDDINTEIITRFRIGTIFLIFNQEEFPATKYNLSLVLSEITDHFLYGIATQKGAKLIQKYKLQRTKSTAHE